MIKDESVAFWDALKLYVPEVRQTLDSKPKDEVAAKFRTEAGGNLLFRTVGRKAFARAARTGMDRGATAKAIVKRLSAVPLELDSKLWREVFWRKETATMLTKYGSLAQNIFLDQIGEKPVTKKNVAAEYQRITGRSYTSKK